MKKALVVGGNSGLGLSLVLNLLKDNYEYIYIVGKDEPLEKDIPNDVLEHFKNKTQFIKCNLVNCEYDFLEECKDINTLILTCGFGRVAPFEELTSAEINNLIKVNEISIINIVKFFYNKILSNEDFYCTIISSIAGHIVSPLFSIYGVTKFALHSFIENVNSELISKNKINRILEVAPGSLKGTGFNGKDNSLNLLGNIPLNIMEKMLNREMIYIPDYNEIYKGVIERYRENPLNFAKESYEYKIKNNRVSNKAQVKIGYLSGTFDLFHIGHLNLLKRAKEYCDYLIVGVHESGSWKGKETFIPFEERKEILKSIKYVDKVVNSESEDSDAWNKYHYNFLFVGSDYKGTERFQRYEEFFKDKDIKIIYFPYTKTTSSTQLRNKIREDIN